MMSKHLFFNAMREDLRHKLWMIVLFSLISFLAVPMVWLLIRSNTYMDWNKVYYYSDEEIRREINEILVFFTNYLVAMGGTIAIMAGLVTGLSSFRYVFHKNRVDTYHSLPIKRSTLYGVCYVDGILVWLAPFLVCLILTLAFAGGFIGRLGGAAVVTAICALTGKSLLVMLTVFLLVYHLVLVAVMLSGNILNTLVNMVILGFGAISVYGMCMAYFDFYMRTFDARAFSHDELIYASPLFSALYFLFFASDMEGSAWDLGIMILVNMLVALFLGVCGWMLYQRRASEIAEQGVHGKVVTAVLRVITGMVAGMGGWMLFVMITDNMEGIVGAAWKSFGAILLSVFVFGVLDVIYHMEFGAFFAHKLQMAGTVFLTLVLCFAFYCDWFGYDIYLPEKEEIAQLAVYDRQFSTRYGRDAEATWEALENMQFQDVDVIYAFLESAVNGGSGTAESSTEPELGYEYVNAKITLKNGRSYYRHYTVAADRDILWPLFSSGEYLENAYLIRNEDMDEMQGIILYREGKRLSVENAELVADIVRAYHQDVLEHTEEVLSGEGQLMVRVRPEVVNERNGSTHWNTYTLDIYSFMEHATEVLKQAGYEEWVEPWEASSVSAVRLGLYADLKETETAEDIIAKAMIVYGVEETLETELQGTEDTDNASAEGIDNMPDEKTDMEHAETAVAVQVSEDGTSPTLQITDQAEIEELLSYISYVNPDNYSGLRRQYVRVEAVDLQGNSYDCYVPRGVLPMKYIRRFVDVVRAYGVEVDETLSGR